MTLRLLAMQKVEGSSPFSRSSEGPWSSGPFVIHGRRFRRGRRIGLGERGNALAHDGQIDAHSRRRRRPESHDAELARVRARTPWLTGGTTRLADSSAAITTSTRP